MAQVNEGNTIEQMVLDTLGAPSVKTVVAGGKVAEESASYGGEVKG